jgi:hypothetical protein
MPIVRKTRAELQRFRLTRAQRQRLDAMTDAEITAAAKSDPDNPPITNAEWKRMTKRNLKRPRMHPGELLRKEVIPLACRKRRSPASSASPARRCSTSSPSASR